MEQYIGRKPLIKRLEKRYNLQGKGPQEKVVRLPFSREVVRISVFDAEDCLVQLLTNPLLTANDFDFFDDDPLAGPPQDSLFVGNINTGAGYEATYEALVKGPNEQVMGVLFYIDGAVTGQFSDLPVTAVKISLTCLTRVARLKEHAWAVLGYIPTIRHSEGRGKKVFKESGHLEAEDIEIFDGEGEKVDQDGTEDDQEEELTNVKAQDFHYMLKIILSSFKKLQDTGFVWDMMHKGQASPGILYHLYVPIVRCDTEEADTLCAKYKSRGRHVAHICRQCHCPTLLASDHRQTFPMKTQPRIEKLIKGQKIEQLRAISQHYVSNAWYNIRFNQLNDRGIHGATPSEMLHALQLGIFKYTRDILFEQIGAKAAIADDINGLARVFGKLLARQSDRTLPNTNFSGGIKDGKLMAKDFRGVLLVMAAVLRSTKGREMLNTKKKFRKEHQKRDWQLLVELLLEWEAFLCQTSMRIRDVKRLDKKHSYIMYIMKKVAKRSKGMGLNIIKFHTIRHLMDDIIIHGVPLEFDTAANESHHKLAKLAAKLTQRNEATFQYQVALRMHEFRILDLALHDLNHDVRNSDYYRDFFREEDTCKEDDTGSEEAETLTDDTRFTVYVDAITGENAFHMLSRGKSASNTSLNIDLLEFLIDLQSTIADHLAEYSLPIFTRHVRNGNIFHGHPNYRGQGVWKDWVIVDWGAGYGNLPCQIHCFVVLENLPMDVLQLQHGGIRLKNGVYAVVESTELEDDDVELKKSDLFVPYIKHVDGIDENGEVIARCFYLADTEAFVEPCAVIPDIGGQPNRYFHVKGREHWTKEFSLWLKAPQRDDETSSEEEESDQDEDDD